METHTETRKITAARVAYKKRLDTLLLDEPPDISRMIKELTREIGQRNGVYPKLIASGRLHPDHAARQTVQLYRIKALLEQWQSPGLLNGEDT